MNDDDTRRALLACLGEVAPETDLAAIDAERPLRAQVDLDSADWLHLLVVIHERLGVEIPDAQAPRLRTLAQLAAWCATAGAAGRGAG